jgi:hypothetical protein
MRRLASLAAFAAWIACSVAAQNNPESPLADAPPAPSSGEQTRVLEETRRIALEYTANLPNFICTETIQRSTIAKSGQQWKLADTLLLDLAFSAKGESHKLLNINGKPTKKTFNNLDGVISDSDFGTILSWIFRPKSQTHFQWERWTNLRGLPTHVFSYHVDQSHSEFQMISDKLHRIAAFGGLVYVDRETSRVMRITYAPTDIPSYWPIAEAGSTLDYGLATIGEQQFFLPRHAELILTARNGRQARNVMEFSNYRKFSAEAIFSFEKDR